MIRKAEKKDISRIAEILIFGKRSAYRPIFRDDKVSFGAMQVLPLAQELSMPNALEDYYVYDDEFVKGVMIIKEYLPIIELKELYVEPLLTGTGIGGKLIDFFLQTAAEKKAESAELWVLEKNAKAIKFYSEHGFCFNCLKEKEKGTNEYKLRYQKSLL